MSKRIQIIIRNPGFEKTDNALGLLELELEDQQHLEWAIGQVNKIRSGIAMIEIWNQKGQRIGFNSE